MAAQHDDQVLARRALRQRPVQLDSRRRRHLPPSLAGRPDRRGVRPDDRRAEAAQAAVHVGVAVGGDDHRVGQHVALLDEHLVADASAGRVVVNPVRSGERRDGAVLVHVGLASILYVVVHRKYQLARRAHPRHAHRSKLLDDRARVVVCHATVRRDRDIVAGGDLYARCEVDGEPLRELLDESLPAPHGWTSRGVTCLGGERLSARRAPRKARVRQGVLA
eukprot:2462400-Prymnesium_polylepis.1